LKNQAIGAAYGTAKSGIGIAGAGTFRPELIMKVNSFICNPFLLICILMLIIILVTFAGRYGRYYRCLWSCNVSFNNRI